MGRTHVADYVDCCRATRPVVGDQVVFPTTGFSSYSIGRAIEGNLIDWDIIYGTKIILFTSCYAYNTLGTPHITSFCFYFSKWSENDTTNLGFLPNM
jgi:hypothetical protein